MAEQNYPTDYYSNIDREGLHGLAVPIIVAVILHLGIFVGACYFLWWAK